MTARLPGRQFFANPGPTNIPDSVLREMSRATVDFMAADFLEVYDRCVSGVKRVLGTAGDVFFYTASGHGAWEATIVNLFSPGDAVLVVESGVFSESWAGMMRSHGLDVRTVAADWRRGLDCGALTQALRGEDAEAIRAVLRGAQRDLHRHDARPARGARRDGRRRPRRAAAGGRHLLRGLAAAADGRLGHRRHGGRQPEGADAAGGLLLHRRLAARHGGARAGAARPALLRLDGDAGAPAPLLRGHGAGGAVLRAGRVPAPAGGRGHGRRAGPPPSPGGRRARGRARLVGQRGAARCSRSTPPAPRTR